MRVNGNDIYLITGDTGFLTLKIKENDSYIDFQIEDKIYFTVKTSISTNIKTFQKIFEVNQTSNEVTIELHPNDTKDLPARSYVYDIQYVKVSGEVHTVVPPSNFILVRGVTDE